MFKWRPSLGQSNSRPPKASYPMEINQYDNKQTKKFHNKLKILRYIQIRYHFSKTGESVYFQRLDVFQTFTVKDFIKWYNAN